MPRGGRRTGAPGQSYTNRTDLNQPVRTVPGQTYGQAGQQAAAQQAIPLPQSAGPPPPGPGLLAAPSNRPGEPVTAGLPIGPGPGPEAVGMPTPDQTTLSDLKVLLVQHPNEQLRQIVERLEQSSGVLPRG
jgi:hypothetical protein